MDIRVPVLVMMVAVAPLVSATGTGPTMPEKSRDTPLDTREPRQDVIDERGGSEQQARPPTLEVPRKMAPTTPPAQDGGSGTREADGDAATGR